MLYLLTWALVGEYLQEEDKLFNYFMEKISNLLGTIFIWQLRFL